MVWCFFHYLDGHYYLGKEKLHSRPAVGVVTALGLPCPIGSYVARGVLVLKGPSLSAHRSGPFEVRADLEESMEFVDPGVAGESDESGDEHVSDEETDLGTDWENLPSPRFCDIPSQPVEVSESQSTQASPPIASSSAGGMISSAAASVTSWFKAYTGHR